jgi:ADP-ribosylation factor protein 6
VIDSCDYERIDEARRELEKILNDREMRNVSLLLLCNKQDVSGSMQPDEIRQALHLDKLTRPYALMPCSALNGNGLSEGLKWLSEHCK